MKAQKTTKTAIAERHRTLRAVDTVIRSRIRAQIRAAWKAKALTLSRDKRQEILDMLRTCLTADAIALRAGVDCDTVYGVLYLNRYSVQLLREESL